MLLQNDLKVLPIENGEVAISHASYGGCAPPMTDQGELSKYVTLLDIQYFLKSDSPLRNVFIWYTDIFRFLEEGIAAVDVISVRQTLLRTLSLRLLISDVHCEFDL